MSADAEWVEDARSEIAALEAMNVGLASELSVVAGQRDVAESRIAAALAIESCPEFEGWDACRDEFRARLAPCPACDGVGVFMPPLEKDRVAMRLGFVPEGPSEPTVVCDGCAGSGCAVAG